MLSENMEQRSGPATSILNLRPTPSHQRTAAIMRGQTWRRWAGFVVASSYELTHECEYHAVRNAAALFDVSPLYKYHIEGPDAARLLDRIITRKAGAAAVGQVLYTTWCDHHGKVIDDGTVTRLNDRRFRLTAADPNYRWLGDNARQLDVRIEDVSDCIAALALQGPTSRAILEQATETDLSSLKYFRMTQAAIRGTPVTITRTGYTGDLGYEIWVDAAPEAALPVWDTLIECGAPYGIIPAGMLALDMARIEAGLLLIEVDYYSSRRALIEGQKSSPFELSLDWTVALDKPQFNGRRALREEQARGPAWRFVGVEVDWTSLQKLYAERGLAPRLPTQAWRMSVPLYAGGRQVGYATSGSWSPLLKRYLTLAHLESRFATPGTPVEIEITVEHRRRRALGVVGALPYFNPDRKRT